MTDTPEPVQWIGETRRKGVEMKKDLSTPNSLSYKPFTKYFQSRVVTTSSLLNMIGVVVTFNCIKQLTDRLGDD